MNNFIEFVHAVMPVLHALAIIALLLKIIIISQYKGFEIPYFLRSFFRMYNYIDKSNTSNEKRLRFMKINNLLNIYLYLWIFLTLVMFIIYRWFLWYANIWKVLFLNILQITTGFILSLAEEYEFNFRCVALFCTLLSIEQNTPALSPVFLKLWPA